MLLEAVAEGTPSSALMPGSRPTDDFARVFIEGLPPDAVVRISKVTTTRERYVATYQGMSLKVSQKLRDELLASGRAVEES
jgi:hypothetical protein